MSGQPIDIHRIMPQQSSTIVKFSHGLVSGAWFGFPSLFVNIDKERCKIGTPFYKMAPCEQVLSLRQLKPLLGFRVQSLGGAEHGHARGC